MILVTGGAGFIGANFVLDWLAQNDEPVVNLDKLGSLFPEGGTVGVDELVAKGAVRKGQLVKVLGTGEISVALQVTADKFSTSAAEKIAAAGGSTTVR